MLKYHYTITNNFNGKSFVIGEDLEGNHTCDTGKGILLQQYPGFELDVRNEEQEKSGQHGIWDYFSFYGKRNITFQGLILAEDHANLIAYERLMQEVLSLPAQPIAGTNDGYVTISWTDDDSLAWQINAKIQTDVQFSRQLGQQSKASFFINMKASDPIVLSATQNSQSGLLGWRQGQMVLPAFLENNINITFNNVIQIYQNGNTDAPAIYRLYGAVQDPKITKLEEVSTLESTVADFSDSEVWTGGTVDNTIYQSGGQARRLTSIAGAQAVMNLTGSFDLDYKAGAEVATTVSSMDSTSGFSGTGDTTNIQTDFSVKQEGNASLKFDIDVSLSGSNYAGVINTTLTPVDVSAYEELYVDVLVNIPDVTNITGVYLMLGSDVGVNGKTATAATDYLGNAFVNGWNTVRFTLSSMSDFGTGLDLEAIDSCEARLVYSGGQADMSSCRFDAIVIYGSLKRNFVTFYFYVDEVNNMATGDYLTGENYIKFIENAGVDEFVVEFSEGNSTIRNGWNYFRLLKDEFEIIGTPSWGDITEIELSIKSAGSTTLNIVFDDIKVKNITFTETTLELSTTLLAGEYVEFDVAQGTITKSDGTDLSGSLTLASSWFYVSPGQNSFIYESADNPPVSWEYPTQQVDILWNDALIYI